MDNGELSNRSGSGITIDKVSKTYATSKGDVFALGETSFEVKPGEFVVLLGPSGCGKTTLLRMLAGLHSPSTGNISIGDIPLFLNQTDNPNKKAVESLGFVFQQANLLPWRSVLKNIALPLEVLGVKRAERHRRAAEMAELVGLHDFLRHLPQQLSGGMQQRVAIARALIHNPGILLMDEPFGALDALTRDYMNEQLQEIWMRTGKTIVLVTHSITEAVFLADRVVLLSARPGRIQDVVEVNFPRPRPLEKVGSSEFGEHVTRLRAQLGD